MTIKDIAWIAGLLEGEGYFHINKFSPSIDLGMTDFDIVARAAKVLGAKPPKVYYYKKAEQKHWKPHWKTSIHSALAVGWMMTIYSFLGERRQQRVREVIETWKLRKQRSYLTLKNAGHAPASCHPDRPAWSLYHGQVASREW
jgi:hypothetical protein